MVAGPRRCRSNYSVNLRWHGKTAKERYLSKRLRQLIPILLLLAQRRGMRAVALNNNMVIIFLLRYLHVNRRVNLHNPLFIRTNLRTNDFDGHSLYEMRITDRGHVPLILQSLQFPAVIRCPNRTICNGEKALLLLLYVTSFPTRLVSVQVLFGREYSQISRIVKAVFEFIDRRWKHLIQNNIAFFVPRFPMYNQAIIRKYARMNNGAIIPRRWRNTAIFVDGTKNFINRTNPINYTRYKKRYCLSYMVGTCPDGMICIGHGPLAGSHVDHYLQNQSNLNLQLVNSQIGAQRIFTAGTDKGFHLEQFVVPMHNNVFNTAAQTNENAGFSKMRVTNEHDIGRVTNEWKYIDFSKLLTLGLKPLGKQYRVCIIMTNLLTILDYNSTTLYYDCPPPTLAEYFV